MVMYCVFMDSCLQVNAYPGEQLCITFSMIYYVYSVIMLAVIVMIWNVRICKHVDEIHSSTHSLSSCLSYNVMLFIGV